MQEYKLLIVFAVVSIIALLVVLKPLGKYKLKTNLLVCIILMVVTTLYYVWGGYLDFHKHNIDIVSKKNVGEMLKNIKGPQDLIDKMSAHLQKDPNSYRGWYLLGRIYYSQNMKKQALDCFAKAYKLSPDDNLIIVNYSQTLLETDDLKGREMLESLLDKDPKQPDALSILAMDAYRLGKYKKAIDYWQRLLVLVPRQSEESEAIRKAIAKAHSQDL
ncbi:MAG: tetratricopeptide repeat protein [Legionellaceae bacterium]|nr:tetratricopeptide repeat protein [Legionellaceae bacterium]